MTDTRTPRPSVAFLMWRDSRHPEGGGSELFVERVAEHLAGHGWDVTITCAAYPGAQRDEERNRVRYRRRGGRLTVYLRGLSYLLTAEGRRVDAVIDVQNGVPFWSALVRRRRPVVNLVHHVHREQWQIIYPGLVGHVGWWLESRVAPRVYRGRRYLTVSAATRQDLVGLGVRAGDIDVVYNGIDVPHPDHMGPRADVPTVCVLGRLVPHKRVEHALEVAARLRHDHPSARYEIVGDGWWRDRLEARARELAVDDIVIFHGGVSDAERDRILDRSWIMLVPSIKEGWGIAIMEAAARSVPAIAYTSAGGVRESIVDGATGLLVDDLAGLAKRTEELLGDAEFRNHLGDHARDRAAEFSWAHTGDAVRHLLERVRSR